MSELLFDYGLFLAKEQRYWSVERGEPQIRFVAKDATSGAIVEAKVGEGFLVLFGFQPDYRGQTVTTWPLLFNALAGGE